MSVGAVDGVAAKFRATFSFGLLSRFVRVVELKLWQTLGFQELKRKEIERSTRFQLKKRRQESSVGE